jgi:tetratricopeptide (TPR) repeat protein
MDPDNPVIQLCVQGVEAEAQARFDDARVLYENAWRASRDDVEACIAAHYIARQQHNLDQALWWNQIALARADSVRDGRVRAFYASLHLNLGMAHENLGQLAAARHHYERASETLHEIDDDKHRVLVQYGVTRGLKRTAQS